MIDFNEGDYDVYGKCPAVEAEDFKFLEGRSHFEYYDGNNVSEYGINARELVYNLYGSDASKSGWHLWDRDDYEPDIKNGMENVPDVITTFDEDNTAQVVVTIDGNGGYMEVYDSPSPLWFEFDDIEFRHIEDLPTYLGEEWGYEFKENNGDELKKAEETMTPEEFAKFKDVVVMQSHTIDLSLELKEKFEKGLLLLEPISDNQVLRLLDGFERKSGVELSDKFIKVFTQMTTSISNKNHQMKEVNKQVANGGNMATSNKRKKGGVKM